MRKLILLLAAALAFIGTLALLPNTALATDTALALVQDTTQANGGDVLAQSLISGRVSLLVATGLLGLVASLAYGGLKQVLALKNKLPAQVQRILVTIIGEVLAVGGNFLGVTLPENLASFDVAALQGLAASLLGMGLYQLYRLARKQFG